MWVGARGGKSMNKKEKEELIKAMHEFAIRVLKGGENMQETAILPDVIKTLFDSATEI